MKKQKEKKHLQNSGFSHLNDLASTHLDKALSIDNNHQGSIILLCDIYAKKSEYKKALEILKKCNRDNYFHNYLNAEIAFKSGDYQKATRFIDKCINDSECTVEGFILAKNIFSKNNEPLRYKICLEKIVATNIDRSSYYIELESCYNHADEYYMGIALLEIALGLADQKKKVLLTLINRTLKKYKIGDDGSVIREVDYDRLNEYYLSFSDFLVRDTDRIYLAIKLFESNSIELAFNEVGKIKKKSGDFYHFINGFYLFTTKHIDASFEHLSKVSKKFRFYYLVESLLGQVFIKTGDSIKAKKSIINAISKIDDLLHQMSELKEVYLKSNNFDQVYQLTISSNNLKVELDKCYKLLS